MLGGKGVDGASCFGRSERRRRAGKKMAAYGFVFAVFWKKDDEKRRRIEKMGGHLQCPVYEYCAYAPK